MKLNGDNLSAIIAAAGVLLAIMALWGGAQAFASRPVREAEAHVLTTQSDATLPQTEDLAWERVNRSAQWTAFVTEVRAVAQTAARVVLGALAAGVAVVVIGGPVVVLRKAHGYLPDGAHLLQVDGVPVFVDTRTGMIRALTASSQHAADMTQARAIATVKLADGRTLRALSAQADAWQVVNAISAPDVPALALEVRDV